MNATASQLGVSASANRVLRQRMPSMSASLIAITLTCASCGSIGPAQMRVNERPIRFADARSGARVEPVLIIPRYSSMTGVSTAGGHGPGQVLAEERFVAHPFVYWEGLPFQPEQPDSQGLLLGPVAFAGRGITLDGVVVVSRTHQALWWWTLWERRHGDLLQLEPATNASAHQRRMLQLLESDEMHGQSLSQDEQSAFGLGSDFTLKIRFSAEERKRIREFLTSGV